MKRHLFLAILAASLAAPLPALAQGRDKKRETTPTQPSDPFKDGIPAEKEEGKKGAEKGKIDLRPKFEKGQVIKFKMDLDQKSKVLMPAVDEKPTETLSKQELGLVFKVKDVTTDGTVVEMTFSRVKMTKKADDENEEFDSNQPASKDKNSTLAPSLRALSATTFTLHLDPDGNVTNIEGGSEIMSLEALGTSPSSLPGGAPAPSGGGGGLKDAIGSIFSIKKGSGLVSVGEEWTNADTMDSPLIGKLKMTSKHKLRSHSGGEAKVSVMGSMEPDSASPGTSFVKISDASHVGDYVWSTREGMLRRMNMHQHVVMEAAGVNLTTDMKSVVTRTN